jgi:hypothetical protein
MQRFSEFTQYDYGNIIAIFGFPPILLGIKESKRKEKKSKRKKRRGLVSVASAGHPLDFKDFNTDKCHPLYRG